MNVRTKALRRHCEQLSKIGRPLDGDSDPILNEIFRLVDKSDRYEQALRNILEIGKNDRVLIRDYDEDFTKVTEIASEALEVSE